MGRCGHDCRDGLLIPVSSTLPAGAAISPRCRLTGNQPVHSNVTWCVRTFLSVISASVLLLTACGGGEGPTPGPVATARIEVTALAGPVCPVETDPPSPECAPRPVDAATIVVVDSEGAEAGRGSTGPDGFVMIDAPPGEFTVVPGSVEGLLGTAAAVAVKVVKGQTLQVVVDYDTGVR